MGARLSARAHLQGVRLVFRAAQISRAAVPRGARALRAAHHPRRRDAGDFPRGRTDARRKAQGRRRSGLLDYVLGIARDPRVPRAHSYSAGGRRTTTACSRTGRCCASSRRREGRRRPSRLAQLGEVDALPLVESRASRFSSVEAVRSRRGNCWRPDVDRAVVRGESRSVRAATHRAAAASAGALRRGDVAHR